MAQLKTHQFIIQVLFFFGVVHGFISWIAVRLPLEGTPAAPGAPWPLPQSWTNSSSVKWFDPSTIQLTHNLQSTSECDIVDEAFKRYRKLIQLASVVPDDSTDGVSELVELHVNVVDQRCDGHLYPDYEDSETYSLVINSSSKAELVADNVWGVLRGLETFSQLIYLTEKNEHRINETSISDHPRFSHRGLMIDTARHYYPVKTILSILDAMSYDKLNVLHWHIVDDQSFPFVSRTFPNLSLHGAYTPHHVYSREAVLTVLNEARLRGIRVIPEFDTPGHTWSWGQAFPSLITPCWGAGLEGGPYVANYTQHGPAEVINPMLNSTYEFLRHLFEEISMDFPDKFIHLGMDEAYYKCWESNPNMTEWMLENNLSGYNEVEQYYARKLIDIIESFNTSKYIIWQDPIDNNVTVQSSALIEVWKDTSNSAMFSEWQTYTLNVARKGYNMILSSPWYLNMITYGQDWRKYYMTEPHNFTTDPDLQSLIKGGEACVWSEYIDPSNFLSLVWPRVSAVAERLWSSKDTNDVESAKFRLDQQRCRLIRRGIPAKPILTGYCGDYDWDMQQDETTTIGTTPSSVDLSTVASSTPLYCNGFAKNILALFVAFLVAHFCTI